MVAFVYPLLSLSFEISKRFSFLGASREELHLRFWRTPTIPVTSHSAHVPIACLYTSAGCRQRYYASEYLKTAGGFPTPHRFAHKSNFLCALLCSQTEIGAQKVSRWARDGRNTCVLEDTSKSAVAAGRGKNTANKMADMKRSPNNTEKLGCGQRACELLNCGRPQGQRNHHCWFCCLTAHPWIR